MREDLERAHEAHRRRAWANAYDLLVAADKAESLPADYLELLATAAYLVGREVEALTALERAYPSPADATPAVQVEACAGGR